MLYMYTLYTLQSGGKEHGMLQGASQTTFQQDLVRQHVTHKLIWKHLENDCYSISSITSPYKSWPGEGASK